MQLLIANGADVNTRDESNKTPLHLLGRGCFSPLNVEKSFCVLIDSGANFLAKDKFDNTLLHSAAIYYPLNEETKKEYCKVLLQSGADLSAKNTEGKKPMDMDGGLLRKLKEEKPQLFVERDDFLPDIQMLFEVVEE